MGLIQLQIDFETYYDKDYSLSKMPTVQYVRDPRFQCLGASIAIPGSLERQWVEPDQLRQLLDRLPPERVEVVAHNALFDGAILAEHFGWTPGRYTDTAMLARYGIAQGHLPADARTGLWWYGERYGIAKGDTAQAVAAGGQELADYATRDLEIMDRLLTEAETWGIPEDHRQLMDTHVRMATEPVLALDVATLEAEAAKPVPEVVQTLRKRDAFAHALRQAGVEPETKPGKKGETYAFAKTDAFMRGLARHSDPRVRKLHELRTEGASNIVRTRAQRLLDVGEPFPIPLQYYAAHTGRAGGLDKLNPQNLPNQGPLRRSILAPPGYKLVVVDLKQIEVRVLAWLAGERWLLEAFERGDDPYRVFASQYLYRKPQSEITDGERKIAKAAVLALGFGQGPNGFLIYCQTFGVPMDEATAQWVVDVYRRASVATVNYWHQTFRELLETGELQLPSGRRLTYPDLRRDGREYYFDRHSIFSKARTKRDTVKLWHGIAVENRVQATAWDVIRFHTNLISPHWKVVMQVHDEVVLCVPEDWAEAALQHSLALMKQRPEWAQSLPVEGEGAIAQSYGEAK